MLHVNRQLQGGPPVRLRFRGGTQQIHPVGLEKLPDAKNVPLNSYTNFCPRILPRIADSEFSQWNFSRSFRASFTVGTSRFRPEKMHQKSPPFLPLIRKICAFFRQTLEKIIRQNVLWRALKVHEKRTSPPCAPSNNPLPALR